MSDSEEKGGGLSLTPLLERLEELRWRLFKSAIAIVVLSIAAFYFSDHIVRFIMWPLGGVKLHNLEVTGTFYAYMKISLIIGLLAGLPYMFFQMWAMISPALPGGRRHAILPLVLISTILFLIGAAFCFFIVMPVAIKFLIGFSDNLVINNITISSYISFIGILLLAFGLTFELPVAAYFLAKLHLLNTRGLGKARRYAIVIILFVAGIVTPTPDIFTQLLMAVPMYILYEISIVVVWWVRRKEKTLAVSESSAGGEESSSG